jgi:hypothetical protein
MTDSYTEQRDQSDLRATIAAENEHAAYTAATDAASTAQAELMRQLDSGAGAAGAAAKDYAAVLDSFAAVVAMKLARLCRKVCHSTLARMMADSDAADQALARIAAAAVLDPSAVVPKDDLAKLTKQAYKGTETAATVEALRAALLKPRAGTLFDEAVDGVVSNPSSPYMVGSGGPNFVPKYDQGAQQPPMSVVGTTLAETRARLERAKALCTQSQLRVLRANLVLIQTNPDLAEAGTFEVMSALAAIAATDALSSVGLAIKPRFQPLGEATFPHPHFQQDVLIHDAATIFAVLAEQALEPPAIYRALLAYLTAQGSFATTMCANGYSGKFVSVDQMLDAVRADRREEAEAARREEDEAARREEAEADRMDVAEADEADRTADVEAAGDVECHTEGRARAISASSLLSAPKRMRTTGETARGR